MCTLWCRHWNNILLSPKPNIGLFYKMLDLLWELKMTSLNCAFIYYHEWHFKELKPDISWHFFLEKRLSYFDKWYQNSWLFIFFWLRLYKTSHHSVRYDRLKCVNRKCVGTSAVCEGAQAIYVTDADYRRRFTGRWMETTATDDADDAGWR